MRRMFFLALSILLLSCKSNRMELHTYSFQLDNGVDSGLSTLFFSDTEFACFKLADDYVLNTIVDTTRFRFKEIEELNSIPNKKVFRSSFSKLNATAYFMIYSMINLDYINEALVKGKFKVENYGVTTVVERTNNEILILDVFNESDEGVLRTTFVTDSQDELNRQKAIVLDEIVEENEFVLKKALKITRQSYIPNFLAAEKLLKAEENNYASKIYQALLYRSPLDIDNIDLKFNDTDSLLANYKAMPAKEYIKENVKDIDIVAINENHYNLENRIFTALVLEDFYKKGFRTLFVEGIDNDIESISDINVYNGFYILNAEYASFLKEALSLGYHIKSYESILECDLKDQIACSRRRDSIQATNIYNKIKKQANPKSLIYAGFDHIHKKSDDRWKKMVEFLSELTGKDIYSIDQAQLVNNTNIGEKNRSFTIKANNLFSLDEPFILVSKDYAIPYRANPKKYDLQLIYPLNSNWYYPSNMYRDVIIKLKESDIGSFLYQYRGKALPKIVPDRIIPIDKKIVQLDLKNDKYEFLVIDKNGKIKKSLVIDKEDN